MKQVFTLGAILSAGSGMMRWFLHPELTKMQALIEYWPHWVAVLVFAALATLAGTNKRG